MPWLFKDDFYGKKLWEAAVAKAVVDIKKRNSRLGDSISETKIVLELFKEANIPDQTYWGWKRDDRNPRQKTIDKLIKYLKFRNYDAFKLSIDIAVKEKGINSEAQMEEIENDPFLKRIYEHFPIGETGMAPSFTINLLKSLYRVYTHDGTFNSIRLTADMHGKFGKLPMSEYFIQLSYLEDEEIKTKESIIENEVELNKTKLYRTTDSGKGLTKDYVMNYNIPSVHHLLIIGSPGVGKSTFSRWLCNAWTISPDKTKVIPIYISLKNLNFNLDKNSLLNYLAQNYLNGSHFSENEISEEVLLGQKIIVFILDGYDELADDNKEKLAQDISKLTSNLRFILTSRPYGMLKKTNLQFDQTIQLDGLDSGSIDAYLEKFLLVNKAIRSKQRLLDIIENNPTLTDFAHNPLMLSFIVFIFLKGKNGHTALDTIQTRYDLQKNVIDWMFEHNSDKMDITFSPQLEADIAAIAFGMELDKTPEKIGRVSANDTKSSIIQSAQIGIGQLSKYDANRYAFVFNSITFQEYFAAIATAKIITPAAFRYLLKDSYFWNLAAMLVGYLNSSEKKDVLDELITISQEALLQNDEKQDHSYYLSMLLISECNCDFINKSITENFLITICDTYIASQTNERLKHAIIECTQRVFRKLNDHHKTKFVELISRQLHDSWAAALKTKDFENTLSSHVPKLARHLDLISSKPFIISCIDLLIRILVEINNYSDKNNHFFSVPDELLDIILDYQVGYGDADICDRLKEVYELLPFNNIYDKAQVKCMYTNASEAFKSIGQLIAAINKKPAKLIQEKYIGEVAISIFIAGKKNNQLSEKESKYYSGTTLSSALAIILEYIIANNNEQNLIDKGELKISKNMFHYDVSEITRTVLRGVYTTEGNFNNIEQALLIAHACESAYFEFDIDHPGYIVKYFKEFIEHIVDDNLDEQISSLSNLLYSFPFLRNTITEYRNELSNLMQKYISKHKASFDIVGDAYYKTKNKKDDRKIRDAKIIVDQIKEFVSLLKGDNHKIYENDRRFLIEQLINQGLGELNYFKNDELPYLFSHHVNLYTNTHWEFIKSYLVDYDARSMKNALIIYNNPSIYLYGSNIEFLQTFLEFISPVLKQPERKKFVEENKREVMGIVAKTLLMIKQGKEMDSQTQKDVIYLTGEILANDLIKNTVKKTPELFESDDFVAYILQYYFTKDKFFDLKVDYQKAFKLRDDQICYLTEDIYGAFLQKGVLPAVDLAIIEIVIGKKFIKELNDYHEMMKVYNYPFQKDVFLKFTSA
jgi:DNA polymerase III delta prime subunit